MMSLVKIAAHSLIFPHPKAFLDGRTLAGVRQMGYEGVELVPIDWTKRDFQRLKRLLREEGLSVLIGWSLGPDEDPVSNDKVVRERALDRMKRLIDTALILGAPILAGLNYAGAGCLTGRPSTRREWDRAVNAYQNCCSYSEENGGPVLCLEPAVRDDSHLINTARQAVAFVRAVDNSRARILLDTHQMLREEESLQAAFADANGHIGYVHLSESHRGIPGRGTVPWREVFGALREQDYQGWLGVEAFWSPDSPVAGRTRVWRPMADSPWTLLREAAALVAMRYEHRPGDVADSLA